ncbi:DNA-3-methyladenine glycosylase 2 family protein [Loktanella sp. IMCC34160]|uniref:DNA-3-methyladenine glycosylase family protein n=1 Tax=Loktanella sp. IMCC34160 TaxID=2510646 RepID=UPI00101B9195|nr:DNA-3-methyladenine glycosylase [Loktanella sp. IMCC34160]RYG90849.1 DNA-3-methyladenine glycosylase 2 family protein [Loktanella sp. IMCC34160]
MTVGRIIETGACVAEGADWLAAQVPEFARILPLCTPLPLRRSPAGFGALLSAIVGQQVSTASAAAIWGRLDGAGLTTEPAVLAVTEEDLRALGLSRPKARYAKALAEAGVDWDGLAHLPDDQVIATLTAITGIGRWTAEIYAMFALGRADVFAAGDLALQESARIVFDLPDRPSEKALRGMAADWSPWAAVAARLLWAYYRVAKQREGIR